MIERKEEGGGFYKVAEFDHPYPVRPPSFLTPLLCPRSPLCPQPTPLPIRRTPHHPTLLRQATKLMWCPEREPVSPTRDLLATTGDYLRIWNVSPQGPKLEALLNNNKNSEYCAPLTSLDWNREDPSLLGTACIDTTCTIWDVNTQQAKTQIIAHDKEVYDIGQCVRA